VSPTSHQRSILVAILAAVLISVSPARPKRSNTRVVWSCYFS
jgi:hypothetical protein